MSGIRQLPVGLRATLESGDLGAVFSTRFAEGFLEPLREAAVKERCAISRPWHRHLELSRLVSIGGDPAASRRSECKSTSIKPRRFGSNTARSSLASRRPIPLPRSSSAWRWELCSCKPRLRRTGEVIPPRSNARCKARLYPLARLDPFYPRWGIFLTVIPQKQILWDTYKGLEPKI